MEERNKWKKLVTRESTFLERILRFEGYKNMLPEPFTVRQKDLLAVYSNKMTTQYIKSDDFASKAESVGQDIKNIGFENIVERLNQILDNLDSSKIRLIEDGGVDSWNEFEECYKHSRAIILYSTALATFLKQSSGNEHEIEILQKIYDDTEARSSSAWKEIQTFLENISRIKNISLEDINLYTNREFFELVSQDKHVANNLLAQRETFSVMRLENYESEMVSGDEAKVLINSIGLEQDNHLESSPEVKGPIAYKGKVQGLVRLVLSKSDYLKINDGDILVTYMTHPDMVSIFPKISGIITDEGGVLCHAAIISRELKKPCIIGTKIATQVLKDGDLVEVDADNGVVRVLERANK